MRKLLFFLLLCGCAARAQEPPADPDAALKKQWEERFRAADKDHSRSLDRDEAKAGLPKVLYKHFDEIDTNHDGVITPEELWAMHEREVAQRKQRRSGPPR
jgi:Ca2+-binding EF-hand superfamily protein